MKILVSDQLHQAGIDLLKEVGEVEVATGLSKDELITTIKDKDAVLVRSATKLTADVLEHAEKLKTIGRAGVGVDNIDLKKATEMGVLVVNAPGASSVTVSELTFGLILAMARNIVKGTISLRADKWEKKKLLGMELRGKTLGIIGMGRIGTEVVKKAKGFEMKCIAYDPYISKEIATQMSVEMVEQDDVFKKSDFITVHTPLTDDTRHSINKEKFKLMKNSAYIVNCARGGVIDEDGLYEALETGEIAGAALDVFEKEPPAGNKLLSQDNFIATPHLGASTEEAQRFASTIACEEAIKVLKGQPPTNVVNMPRLPPEIMEALKDFIPLAEITGKFGIEMVKGRISDIYVTICGSLIDVKDTSVLTNSALKGALDPILTENVNLLNSSVVAKNRNIKVTESKRENAENYNNLIIVGIKSDTDFVEIKGSLVGKENRIIGINDYSFDMVPQDRMLVMKNVDKPGMIGKVTTVLGSENINIGAMHVGRKKSGENQIMVIKVDHMVNKGALEKISAIEGVEKIRQIEI